MDNAIYLGVNIDHVATLRQARGTKYPDPTQAAQEAILAGADGITLHLREDRRHIQDRDVYAMRDVITVPMNFEMGATDEMVKIACDVGPQKCCLVPEKREELTTEGGLDVVANESTLKKQVQRLSAAGIEVSMFIDPCLAQIEASIRIGAPVIEIHTGAYAEARTNEQLQFELKNIQDAARYAHHRGLVVNAGHGLYYHNVQAIAAIPQMNELNIGHGLVARAVFTGFRVAVADMKALMLSARMMASVSLAVHQKSTEDCR